MSSLIRVSGERSGLISGALDLAALAVATLLAFSLDDVVWTRLGWLIPLVAFGAHLLAGGSRAALVYRGRIQALSSALVSSVVAAAPIYTLLAGPDTARVWFLVAYWAPLTCVALLASRMLLGALSPSVHSGVYCLVGVEERMKVRLLQALYLRPSFRSGRVLDLTVEEFVRRSDPNVCGVADTLAPSDVIVFGRNALDVHDASQRLLRFKIEGRDVHRDSALYSQMTGRLPVAGESSDLFAASALEQASTGFHTRVIDVLRDVVNIAGGIVLLVACSLPILVLMVLVKASGPGPIFFKQERLGKNRKPFKLLKFRTMTVDAEEHGPQWATKTDLRVTRLGRIMRAIHLDEMPQVLNLCRGDINFVGPRPMREHFADLLAQEIPDFDTRFLIKPGLTGWAQTLGPYGQDVEEQKEKFEYDIFYITNRHRLSDLMIVGMTITKFLRSLRELMLAGKAAPGSVKRAAPSGSNSGPSDEPRPSEWSPPRSAEHVASDIKSVRVVQLE